MVNTSKQCSTLVWLGLLSLMACSETIEIPGATFYGETGGYETGYTIEDVGAGLLDPGECVAGEKTGAYGYVYQCQGFYSSKFQFVFDNQLHTIYAPSSAWLVLGNESYEFSKVMACCGPYDDEIDFDEQPIYAENCILDAREAACMGWSRLSVSTLQSKLQVLIRMR